MGMELVNWDAKQLEYILGSSVPNTCLSAGARTGHQAGITEFIITLLKL